MTHDRNVEASEAGHDARLEACRREIEELRGERSRLRNALAVLITAIGKQDDDPDFLEGALRQARAALEKDGGKPAPKPLSPGRSRRKND